MTRVYIRVIPTSTYSGPWRIAGWIGSVVFDTVVTALTVIRGVRLRMAGLRVSLMQTMLQDGIAYYGKHVFNKLRGLSHGEI